jgi:hypothetical protein
VRRQQEEERQRLALKRRRRRAVRGQDTVEYAFITFVILVGLGLGWPFLNRLMDALSTYYESIYYVVLSPIP